MTVAGRRLWAGLDLLDRRLIDRKGSPCGNVDDLELTVDGTTGRLLVTAILSGPGLLARRLGLRRFGAWREQMTALTTPGRQPPSRIPFERVGEIADHVTVAVEAEELASFATERWVRDHVIGPIPGSGHDASE